MHAEEQHLEELYREVLFDHYRRPRNKGALEGAQIVTKGNNPLCGDRVTVYGLLGQEGQLVAVAFDGKACAICTASASMMTEATRGLKLEEAEALAGRVKRMLRGEEPFVAVEAAPDMAALEGVTKFPVRVKCATLSWTTLQNGILAYRAGRTPGEMGASCTTEKD